MDSKSEDFKLKKENLNPGEAGSFMDYSGQSFVKAGDKFQWARITRRRTQGKDEHNPQFKVEDGPHWSRSIRGTAVPWDPGKPIE